MGSRDGLQAGSASVILGQCPPWAHSVTWEIAFKAIGRLKSQFWFTEGELLPFSFFFFSRVSLATAQSRGSSRHQEGGMWIRISGREELKLTWMLIIPGEPQNPLSHFLHAPA